ncbi:MAG: nucleoside deaminase [Spirochaetales bacterium]|nr:nucleoside deaminase [Spirochaetales bacterium]MBO7348522.1 nucleoside deaminase [Spirochaetales bacterium]MBP5757380.1 nucleoside deaminase [Spirochaetales bacterium]
MDHLKYLLAANEVAKKARENGNTPFGAVLVDDKGNIIMEQGNAEGDLHDATAHAERMLASRASQAYSKDFLWKCTLYTTFEPCCMCTGAIYWSNIGKIVYALTEKQLLELTGADEKNPTFNISSRTILAAGQKKIEVLGPFEEIAAAVVEVHKGFWNN